MRYTAFFIFGLLLFSFFTTQSFAQSATPAPTAASCSTIKQTCATNADCQKPGGACATATCQVVSNVPGATTSECVAAGSAIPGAGITAAPATSPSPTGTPLASPCNSWSEIDDSGKVIKQNAIKWEPGDPYPTLTEGKKFKCATIDTAIGSVQTDPVKLVQQLFGILLSLAGGIALLLIIYSGYQIMTSEGNPEKLQAARETLTSAIIGLVFLIFSLVILQIIGVDILRIPGFTK